MKKKSFWKGLLVCVAAAAGLVIVKLIAILLMIMILFFLLFSACSDHAAPHSRREVLAYLREEYPGEEIVVSKHWTGNVNKYGSEDGGRVWSCWYEDLPEVVFEVTSFRRTGGPIAVFGYDLTDNAVQTFWQYYTRQYRTEIGSLDAWRGNDRLELEFSTMAEAYQAAEEVQRFNSWYEAQPHAPPRASLRCSLAGMALPVEPVKDRFLYIKPEEGQSLSESVIENCQRMLEDFYTFYAVGSPDFTKAELAEYSAARWRDVEGVMFLPDGKALPSTLLDGIALMPDAGSKLPYFYISYGGLYELLTRLGMEPEGSPEYYAVTGADGCRYQFSYAPAEVVEGCPCWPVYRDGEALECRHDSRAGCSPVLRLSGEVFQAVTGITAPER